MEYPVYLHKLYNNNIYSIEKSSEENLLTPSSFIEIRQKNPYNFSQRVP